MKKKNNNKKQNRNPFWLLKEEITESKVWKNPGWWEFPGGEQESCVLSKGLGE
jgi:hypothetical protein